MTAPAVRLDFAGPRVRTSAAGILLLFLGMGAALAACLEYRAIAVQRAGLELTLANSLRHSSRDPAVAARAARLSIESSGVARELGTPWTSMLTELENASRDANGRIAVLSVEPDHDKHRVHINGESRDLAMALAYVQKLQTSRALRYPMLDSHEVVQADAEHPVRFALTAEWRELP